MGLFDKLKQAKNFITGGAAEVSVSFEEEYNDGNKPIKVHIHCQVKDADCKVRKVYIKVKATEEVIARDIDIARDEGGNITRYREDVRNVIETYNSGEQMITGELSLEANQTYDWTADIELPSECNGTYHGQNARHEWEVFAGLDMAGNDPDSGWVPFYVYF